MKERKVNLEKFRTAETCNQVFKMQKKKKMEETVWER